MFALIEPSGRVAQVAAQQFPVAPPLVWLDASAHPGVDTTWTAVNGVLAPPAAAPAPTLAQQAAAALGAGLTVASTGTPALDGIYACGADSQTHISAEVTSILLNGTFADGASTIEWLDAAGRPHTFTVAQFKAFATAAAAFVSGCLKVVNGQATALPPASVTIA